MEAAAAAAAVTDRGFGRSGVLRVFIILISTCVASGASGFVGVNVRYPKLEVEAGRLPKAELVVDLLQVLQVRYIKLQGDAHPSILRALSGSKIQVLLTVPDQSIPALAQSQNAASEWFEANILHHFPSTEVTGIVLGSELMTKDPSFAGDLIEAGRKIRSCIAAAGLEQEIRVSASLSMQMFSQWGHKPSSAAFEDFYQSHLRELLDFLAPKGSYVMINVDPFEAHLHDGFALDFAMSSSTAQELLDEDTKVGYSSLLDAAVDSAYSAMEKLGFSNIPVVVGEIGWPWKSSGSESDPLSTATVENAALFAQSLVKRIQSDKGTPHKPEASIRVYVHEFFDIVGPAGDSRRRYGLFSTSQVPRYSFHLSPGVSEAEILMRRVLADNGTNGTAVAPPSGGTGTGSGQFCVAASGAPDSLLSVGLNWACGQGNADCTPIQQNGACYLPDTYSAHASYAFNSYYQKNVGAGATCDFQGAAMLTSTDPSHDSCIFTSSGSSGGGAGTGGGSTSGGTTGPSSSGGILQPFNPSSNTSSGEALHATVGAAFMLAVLVWTWRFCL
ncbi:glucan endo-1,3-beta-glucosidase 2 [Selaginella moellendorffii]|uniref:glucan endo-1,3-beta-glucosidase 2 n=1 Tax=Selaginella moellendorffii TaxID=88036 RepID=UPI000D1C6BDF|nr:glucan endo-1,3-beta-glucosidase 2 [Selaginella moellendorffii]|eukprot:XP_024519267.1 glucan endo-1,3-beta-glucosidase 2 [Selaginella moellendorffii]